MDRKAWRVVVFWDGSGVFWRFWRPNASVSCRRFALILKPLVAMSNETLDDVSHHREVRCMVWATTISRLVCTTRWTSKICSRCRIILYEKQLVSSPSNFHVCSNLTVPRRRQKDLSLGLVCLLSQLVPQLLSSQRGQVPLDETVLIHASESAKKNIAKKKAS